MKPKYGNAGAGAKLGGNMGGGYHKGGPAKKGPAQAGSKTRPLFSSI